MRLVIMRRILTCLILVSLAGCAAIEPLAPEAEAGEEGTHCDLTACEAGLECLAGTCIRPCGHALDCGGRSCLPIPGSATGWCDPRPAGQAPIEAVPPVDRPDAPPAPGERPPPKVPGVDPHDPSDPADPSPAPDDGPAPGTPPAAPPTEPPAAPPPGPPAAPPTESPAEPAPCRHPAGAVALADDAVVPDLGWSGAFDGSGHRVDFTFERFHCDPAYDRYSILAVIVGAEWCGACAQYLRELAGEARQIDAAGALLVFVETEDASYSPASHEVARRVIDRHAPGAPGIRVGDGVTRPFAGAVANAPIVRSYPTVFAVRRSDMRVIANQDRIGAINFAALARLEAERRPPAAPPVEGGDPTPAGCDEELLEPNNDAGSAPLLSPGDQVDGGICDGSADFYRIGHAGLWTLNLQFRHADGDLDVYLWDPARGAPVIGLDGNPVGSASATDDEALVFFGEQWVMVTGYESARAPYRLTLTGH